MADTLTPSETRVVRWQADVFYNTDSGLVDVTHDLEELHELHDLIEHGPHWDTIDRIEVRRVDRAYETLTVEQAGEL